MSRLAIPCPYCKRQMATSMAFAGQMIACPNCRGEFMLSPPPGAQAHSAPPAAATSSPPTFRSTTQSASLTSAQVTAAQLAAARDALPPTAPPQPPPNTARFKIATAQAPTVVPSVDGKLPTLQLADAAPTEKTSGGDKAIPLWLAVLAVLASTVFSVFLLLYTPPEQQSVQTRRADARRDLAQYYGNDAAALRPYQVLLREAQQAHSRGDRSLERQRYRDVLRLLRAEGRSKFEGLTGTPASDEKLSQLLAILLAEE